MRLTINSRWLSGAPAAIVVRSRPGDDTVCIRGLWGAAGSASHGRISNSLKLLTSPPEGYFEVRVRGQTKEDSGAQLDLPSVMGILAAGKRVSRHVFTQWELFGQLHWGVLQANKQDFAPAVRAAVRIGRSCVLPARDVERLDPELAAHCVGVETIEDVVTHLRGLEPVRIRRRPRVRLEHRV